MIKTKKGQINTQIQRGIDRGNKKFKTKNYYWGNICGEQSTPPSQSINKKNYSFFLL